MLDKVTAPPAMLEDVRFALAGLTDEVRMLRELIEARLPVPTEDGDTLSVPEAAAIARVAQQTVRNWCKTFAIGIYDRSRFRYTVSRARLLAHLARR